MYAYANGTNDASLIIDDTVTPHSYDAWLQLQIFADATDAAQKTNWKSIEIVVSLYIHIMSSSYIR